jgi:hypothetical protein
MELEDRAALTATRVAIETGSDDFVPLVERIAELRGPRRGPGRPPSWVSRLAQSYYTDRDLAAAILYHLIRARLWVEPGEDDVPYLSTIGTALGADLLGPDTVDRDEPMQIGCELLGVAKHVGLIALPPAKGRGGRRVVLREPTYERLQRIINGGAKHVLRRVRTEPPTGVRTKKRHDMLIDRPSPPPRVVEAANKIQGTAWRINRAVLALLEKVEEQIQEHGTLEERIATIIGGGEYLTRRAALGEARELATLDRFYFPVFTDFRGRIFQRGGALTYTSGDDYARGLLEFADGEVLNEDGLGWLTYHTAQMWGHKADWPRSADGKPYLSLGDGTAWLREPGKLAELIGRWQEAKHPVQFLAAMLALRDHLEGRHPVHLPVRVDASCSGLQQLALLTADEDLARLVKLWSEHPGLSRRIQILVDVPDDNDFYARVAHLTEFERQDVKAVVMPLLYGAGTKTSAEELAGKRGQRMSKRQKEDAQKIRGAAEQLAPRALRLLRWFQEIAEAHNQASVGALPIRWTTPSGFQVIQDYRYVDKDPTRPDRRAKVSVDGESIDLVKRFYTDEICPWDQVTSISANIVHSLDAALLTEIVAGSNIDRWAVIHDAFAVSANRMWDLVDEDNPRAMRTLYEPDRLAEWVAAWRADGAPMEQCAARLRVILGRDARGPLPAEMLHGLYTLA